MLEKALITIHSFIRLDRLLVILSILNPIVYIQKHELDIFLDLTNQYNVFAWHCCNCTIDKNKTNFVISNCRTIPFPDGLLFPFVVSIHYYFINILRNLSENYLVKIFNNYSNNTSDFFYTNISLSLCLNRNAPHWKFNTQFAYKFYLEVIFCFVRHNVQKFNSLIIF